MTTASAGHGPLLTRLRAVSLVLALLSGPAWAQVRLSGYFSSDYYQGIGRSSAAGSSFENPAAGLILSGEWTPQFSYTLELRTGNGWTPQIEQAWAGWASSDAFRLRLGVYLVPFGRYNESNRPFQTLLVSAPFPYGEVHPASWRDIGVLLEGRMGVFRYAGYIGNGLAEAPDLAGGQQFRDNNKNKGLGLRLAVGISQELELGGSYYRGKQDAANSRNLTLLGADLLWLTKNVRFTAEYARADASNPDPFASGRTEGWFVELGLNFGQLTPLASYQTSKTSDPFHGPGWTDSGAAGLSADHDRWALGATYALHPNVLLKVEYDIRTEGGAGVKDQALRVQAAVHF
jgi:hypothetical protein